MMAVYPVLNELFSIAIDVLVGAVLMVWYKRK